MSDISSSDIRSSYSAPSPEVQHLTTIFRKVEAGEIRVPAFQRSFVWQEPQVIELFESVYKGYPIGSLLLWRVNEPILRGLDSPDLPIRDQSSRVPTAYLLDGMQRLCSLYGAFNYTDGMRSIFRVIFDVEEQEFAIYDARNLPDCFVEMASLFSPKRMLEESRKFAGREDSDRLLERVLELQRIFQEYLLPTVTISNRSVDDVVQMFQRVNSTGTRLSAVDFMRALVWSDEFDLTDQLERLGTSIKSESGFEFEQDTLAKALAVILGKDPVAKSMYTIRGTPPADLKKAVDRTRSAVDKTVSFLKEEFAIGSEEFIPYEGQTLLLTTAFDQRGGPNATLRKWLRQWFLSTTLNESLQGRSDNYVAQQIRAYRNHAENGDTPPIEIRLDLSVQDLLTRRLLRGKALSTGILFLFAENGARDLSSHEVIEPALYLGGFSPTHYEAILSQTQVEDALGKKVGSAKVMANLLIATDSQIDLVLHDSVGWIKSFDPGSQRVKNALASQFIDEECFRFLAEGAYAPFLERRAELMLNFANWAVIGG